MAVEMKYKTYCEIDGEIRISEHNSYTDMCRFAQDVANENGVQVKKYQLLSITNPERCDSDDMRPGLDYEQSAWR